MSLVLKALEKAQKERKKQNSEIKIPSSILETLPPFLEAEQSSVTLIPAEEPIKTQKHTAPAVKKDIKFYKKQNKNVVLRPVPFFKRKLVILWGILSIGIASLLILNRWLITHNPEIPKLIHNSSIYLSQQSKFTAIKNIILEPKLPKLKITGIMWDKQEPIALINGKLLKKGGKILGAKITSIKQREVSVFFKGKKFTISVE